MAFMIGVSESATQRKHSARHPMEMLRVLLTRTDKHPPAEPVDRASLSPSGEVLAGLPETYVVFSDYRPIGTEGLSAKWHVDHVVIGPSGVFVIEAERAVEPRVEPTAQSRTAAARVTSIQRRAAEFREALTSWSNGSLGEVFVKPVLVYTQTDAFVEKLQEGPVKVIPLKWLATEITERTFEQLTPEEVYRIARCLFGQLSGALQESERPQIERLGGLASAWRAQHGLA